MGHPDFDWAYIHTRNLLHWYTPNILPVRVRPLTCGSCTGSTVSSVLILFCVNIAAFIFSTTEQAFEQHMKPNHIAWNEIWDSLDA